MASLPVFVGLDYHMAFVQVCVMLSCGRVLSNFRCRNDWCEIATRVANYGSPVHAAIESCTGAANLAEELIEQARWILDLAHPGYVARMKQSPDKSDYCDARMLADLVRVGYLPKVWLAPTAIRELRQLVRYRQQLINERRSIKLRIGAVLRDQRITLPGVRRWTKVWLIWLARTADLSEQGRWIVDRHLHRIEQLTQDIGVAERRLRQATEEDRVVHRLLSFSGIGEVTAWMLRAEIGRFDRFRSAKQLARFCGLSPRNASSGQRQADAGLIKAANKQLRSTLIEAARRLMRHDPRWSRLADQLRRRGKPSNVIAAAIGNRWMRWLFHEMKPSSQAA